MRIQQRAQSGGVRKVVVLMPCAGLNFDQKRRQILLPEPLDGWMV